MRKEAKAAIAERVEGLQRASGGVEEGEAAVGPIVLPPAASAPLALPSKVEN